MLLTILLPPLVYTAMKDQFGFVCKDGALRDHTAPLDTLETFKGTGKQMKDVSTGLPKQVYRVMSSLILCMKDHLLQPIEGGVDYKEMDADVFDSAKDKGASFGGKKIELRKSLYYIECMKFLKYYTQGESAVLAAEKCEVVMQKIRSACRTLDKSPKRLLSVVEVVVGRQGSHIFIEGFLPYDVDDLLVAMWSRSGGDSKGAKQMRKYVMGVQTEIRDLLCELGLRCSRQHNPSGDVLEAMGLCYKTMLKYEVGEPITNANGEVVMDASSGQPAVGEPITHTTPRDQMGFTEQARKLRKVAIEIGEEIGLDKYVYNECGVEIGVLLPATGLQEEEVVDEEGIMEELLEEVVAEEGEKVAKELMPKVAKKTRAPMSTALTTVDTKLAGIDSVLAINTSQEPSTALAIHNSQMQVHKKIEEFKYLDKDLGTVVEELSSHVRGDVLRANIDFTVSVRARDAMMEEKQVRSDPDLMVKIVQEALDRSMAIARDYLTEPEVKQEVERLIKEVKQKVWHDACTLGDTLERKVAVFRGKINEVISCVKEENEKQKEALIKTAARLSNLTKERDALRNEIMERDGKIEQLEACAQREKEVASAAYLQMAQTPSTGARTPYENVIGALQGGRPPKLVEARGATWSYEKGFEVDLIFAHDGQTVSASVPLPLVQGKEMYRDKVEPLVGFLFDARAMELDAAVRAGEQVDFVSIDNCAHTRFIEQHRDDYHLTYLLTWTNAMRVHIGQCIAYNSPCSFGDLIFIDNRSNRNYHPSCREALEQRDKELRVLVHRMHCFVSCSVRLQDGTIVSNVWLDAKGDYIKRYKEQFEVLLAKVKREGGKIHELEHATGLRAAAGEEDAPAPKDTHNNGSSSNRFASDLVALSPNKKQRV